jgi:hypothetical protein
MISGENKDPAPGADPAARQDEPRPRGKVIDGVEVHDIDRGQVAILFPSNRHAVFVGGPREAEKPVQKLIAATKSGNGGLIRVAGMVNLIKTVDTKQPVWGAVQMTDVYRQAPVVSAFDTFTMVGKLKAGAEATPDADIEFRIEAKGSDAQQVKDAVAVINQGIATGKQHIQDAEKRLAGGEGGAAMTPMAPIIRQVGKVLDSTRCSANGQTATLTATVNGSLLHNPLILLGGFRAEARIEGGPVEARHEAGAGAAPAPAPPPPPAQPPQPRPGDPPPPPGPTVPAPRPGV